MGDGRWELFSTLATNLKNEGVRGAFSQQTEDGVVIRYPESCFFMFLFFPVPKMEATCYLE